MSETEKLEKVKVLVAQLEHELEECRAILRGVKNECEPSQKSDPAPFVLSEDLAEKVTIETTPTELIIRPKAFLGVENFKDINNPCLNPAQEVEAIKGSRGRVLNPDECNGAEKPIMKGLGIGDATEKKFDGNKGV